MATYFGTTPKSDWTANGSASSGHDFINQINEQKGNVANKNEQYQNYLGNVDTAKQTYEDAYKNQTAYGDLYNQAKQSEGVNEAKEQYQNSLNAVNATNTAMTNLPSTINAGSNVVLNASQRNAALGNQMNKYANTLGYWTNQNAADQSQYQTALGAAQNLAGQQMGQEQAKVAQTMQNYQAQMDYANDLYNQLLNERNILRSIYGDMYDDEYKHRMQEIEIWADNLAAETTRYQEQQANYRAQLSKKAQDEALAWQKYMAEKQEKANNSYSNALAKQNDIDQINQVYSNYQKTLANLDKESSNLASYLFGSNSLFGTGFGLGQTTSMKANDLRNKGFEDYLYNESPYLQKVLRENYSDLLGTYGIK